ncbi:MAG: hypothetical protein ACREOG_08835 [Gemmatimonadaceae bacterium]
MLATPLPTPSNRKVTISPVFLQRDAVKRATGGSAAAGESRSKRSGILGSLAKTVEGDKNAIEAARSVLGANAQGLSQNGSATVIVVIGGEAELTKVVESLSRVERTVRVAYVDRSFEDATYDNTVLSSGMVSAVKDAADNLWVYLPRATSKPRSKPDRVLSTKLASATLWNGLFAADGDAVDVNQLKSLVASDSSKSVSAQGETFSPASPSSDRGGLTVGDVVSPKIANVKVLAEASADGKVLGTVAKTDELVIASPPKNGFVMVEGASVRGWVSATLLSKR